MFAGGAIEDRKQETGIGNRKQVPGCTCRIVDAHHIVHWANGGAHELDNLVSVCRHHHTLVHEGGYRVELDGDVPRFFRPDGREIPNPPPPTSPSLELRLGAEEIAAQRMTLVSRWDGTRVDYAEVVATLV